MVRLNIDGSVVETEPGRVLMEVIRGTGTDVPSMCYLEGEEHFTSCMVCVVKDRKSGRLIPSCSMKAEEGMDIVSGDGEVMEARKTALELLLSEHVGDCEAPCHVTCPAHMDIPLMNRLLAEGKFGEALRVVKRDIALPSVFGRICPAPCESACRRRPIDEAVSICLLKRYAGDHDMEGEVHWLPEKAPDTGKRVAVIGSGPAGLAAAYYLALKGHACTVIDRNRHAGGSLRKEVSGEELPARVLDHEIGLVEQAGVSFELEQQVDTGRFRELCNGYDAVVVAAGKGGVEGMDGWGLPMTGKGVKADPGSYRVGEGHVFAVGSALKPTKLAIRVLGQGKEVSFSVDQFLAGRPVRGEPFRFNSRFGKLRMEEHAEYLKEATRDKRFEPESKGRGLTPDQVMAEAKRCMHCDCRDMHDCRLRLYSDLYDAQQKKFKPEERDPCIKIDQHDRVIFEPSKCIKCGICVRITEKYRESFGLTFIGRGFDVKIGVPLSGSMEEGLTVAAGEVVKGCPTGALSNKQEESPAK